jgi:Na+/melibiose symporter-like transporter
VKQAPSASRLAPLPLTAFSMLAAPIAAATVPLAIYVPAIYAQNLGISLAAVGIIFLLGRIWDAVADPLIGALSDRTRSRWGRRRPWIAAGGLLLGIATCLVFFPPASVSPLYLGLSLFLLYLGWTMAQIPFLAWSGELSDDYHERTRIATYQNVIGAVAFLIVLIVPTVVEQHHPQDGRLKLAAMGAAVVLMLLPALLLTLRTVGEPPPTPLPAQLSFAKTLRLLIADRLLLRVLISDFAVTLAQFTRGSLFVFFVTEFMGLPQWASGLFLLQFAFGIIAAPIWMWIGRRIGKHRAAVAGEVAQLLINLLLLLAARDRLALVLALTVAQGLAQGSGNLMLRSIVADLADKHRLDTGVDRAGLLFSVFTLSSKAATALAVGIAFPLVAWLGFHPGGSNTREGLQGLLLVFALGPAIAHAISAWLIHGFPLDEARHANIRRELARRTMHARVGHPPAPLQEPAALGELLDIGGK